MSKNKQQIPDIRFKGFTDVWEQRKLKDVAPLQRGFDLPKSKINEGPYPVLFSNGIGGWNSEYKAKAPGVVTGRSGSIGNVVFVEENYWPHNTSLWVTNFFDNDPRYVYYLYQHIDLSKFGTGSGVPTLNRNDVHDYSVIIPKPEEQTNIASLFKSIDDTITLHQRQMYYYKELKKATLQKMFPREGEKVPEVRFDGFTGEWEQRKLGEHVTIKSGWSPSNFVRTNSEGFELFIKVDDLNYSSREQKDSQMRVNDNPRFQKMKKGSIIFPKRGAAIMTNKVRILSSDAYMDTNMMALEPQEIDGDFLYTFIALTGLYKIADTSTIPQINNKHIEPYIIYCPSIEEQDKIGSFFKKLDETIVLNQQKVKNYQKLKEVVLKRMFA
ncbi:restriction endonuclease subunit S [Trichococcus shcherbakoviae]|uniref:Restriction endonuclease type i hsds n=1 Tax=Trichococcus shcherbakoviae TaxID=2094020 RepID=A0A383TCV0_9LACT|nr:restriction endonuclease subunit S [Trichococcus shcherbakoviae]SYZ78160.1 restriction endonuclease type i hsds [Trichococcus shcherbakoviae]